VYVHPKFRGQSLGTKLIEALSLKEKVVVSYAHKNYYSKIEGLEFEI
jgi:GNAT superfamily N-acetyltransferase